MKKFALVSLCLIVTLCSCSTEKSVGGAYLEIPADEYQEKVYASWLGQMVGNIYGLVHENKYIDQPGPDTFPYGYDYAVLPGHNMLATDFLKKHGGAFSDDDTDIEYMYLLQMEKNGIEPSYRQLAEAWTYHVRAWVWVANRAALRMMNYGHLPPRTGNKNWNHHWFQIDPQLVNEIWAVTAPGMCDYAVHKSSWCARITSDSTGLEPTEFYAAMYSAAFFENDVEELIEIAKKTLGKDKYFVKVVSEMQRLYEKHPNDWKAARAELSEKYWHNCPEEVKSVYNAVLNGACSILALLYGQGDFQRTLDLSCAMGWDADNQAATMCGLLGIANGLDGIPEDLLKPVKEWTEPFNDRYTNRSRFDLPDASIRDMSERTAELGEKIILKHGGRIVEEAGRKVYQIYTQAEFIQQLELQPEPLIVFSTESSDSYSLNCSFDADEVNWQFDAADLPMGLNFKKGRIFGKPAERGVFNLEVTGEVGRQKSKRIYTIHSLGPNLAADAEKILLGTRSVANGSVTESMTSPSDDPELLRDGKTLPEFYSSYNRKNTKPRSDFFGYQWVEPVMISKVLYHTGWMEQHGGWFTSFDVEYLKGNGKWVSVSGLKVLPEQNLNTQTFAQAHYAPYLCSFEPVETRAIRIIGDAAGKTAWNHKDVVHFINLSELAVF